MVMDCHHIGILTRNPEKMISFYTRGLGFSQGETRILDSGLMEKIFGLSSECRMTKLTKSDAVVEVFSPVDINPDEYSQPVKGYNHWALEVGDKESYIRALDERQVPVLKIDHDGRKIYFLRDPEGNLIEIYERKK